MEDNKQTQTQAQEQPQDWKGWEGIVFSPDMPVNVLIHTLNIFNQRLCQLEDLIKINYEGKTISVTEKMAIDVEKEMKKAQEEQTKAQENKAE